MGVSAILAMTIAASYVDQDPGQLLRRTIPELAAPCSQKCAIGLEPLASGEKGGPAFRMAEHTQPCRRSGSHRQSLRIDECAAKACTVPFPEYRQTRKEDSTVLSA